MGPSAICQTASTQTLHCGNNFCLDDRASYIVHCAPCIVHLKRLPQEHHNSESSVFLWPRRHHGQSGQARLHSLDMVGVEKNDFALLLRPMLFLTVFHQYPFDQTN